MKNRKPYNPKRFEWKFYRIEDNLYFFQTYNQGPTLRACHEGLRPFLVRNEPVAHTSYEGSKKGYITTYLLKTNERKLEDVAGNYYRKIKVRKLQVYLDKGIDSEFNIFSRIIDIGELKKSLIYVNRDDIFEFCHERAAKEKKNGEHYLLVDKIDPNPRFTLIKPKENEVVKFGKGFFHDICPINIGMDFSRGCVSNITPDGIYDLNGRCGYCYAYQNGPSFLETLYDFDEKLFMDKMHSKIKDLNLNNNEIYVRIGQTTEASIPPIVKNFPGFVDNLKIALEGLVRLSDEYKLRIAFPTKVPEFDDETVKLLKRLNVSVFASIGYRELEQGIINLGYPPEKRLENILSLAEMGVNANIYITTNLTEHMLMQDDAKMAMDFFEKNKDKLNLQLLDIRIVNKRIAEMIGGAPWGCLKVSEQKDFFIDGKWGLTGQSYLHAHHTDPYFLELVGNNKGKIRLCSTHVKDGNRKCGMCFMDK